MSLIFEQFIEPETSTYTFLIADSVTKEAAFVDTVKGQSETYLTALKKHGLTLKYLIETHVHADHITGNAQMLKHFPEAKIAISKYADVECEHLALDDGSTLNMGTIKIEAIYTPGHTSESMCYLVDGNRLLSGDTLLINSCGRTDFQAGDNQKMFNSLKRLASLSPDTLVYPGHDYNHRWVSTIREQLESNKLLSMDFEGFKTELNNWNLPPPKRIQTSVPGNKRCGAD